MKEMEGLTPCGCWLLVVGCWFVGFVGFVQNMGEIYKSPTNGFVSSQRFKHGGMVSVFQP